MRRILGLSCLLVGLTAPLLVQAADAGQLFAGMRGAGRLPVVGFAWEGAPQPFSDTVRVRSIADRPDGDMSLSLMLEGGKKACRRLQQVKSEGKKIPKLRLRNEAKDVGVVLRRSTVLSVDCSANPWSVELQTEDLKVKRRNRK